MNLYEILSREREPTRKCAWSEEISQKKNFFYRRSERGARLRYAAKRVVCVAIGSTATNALDIYKNGYAKTEYKKSKEKIVENLKIKLIIFVHIETMKMIH